MIILYMRSAIPFLLRAVWNRTLVHDAVLLAYASHSLVYELRSFVEVQTPHTYTPLVLVHYLELLQLARHFTLAFNKKNQDIPRVVIDRSEDVLCEGCSVA